MRVRFRLFLVSAVVAASAALAGGAGSALAATTVGQTSASVVPCASPITVVQSTTTGPNPYVVPSDGVITSWSTDPANAGSAKLKILHPGTTLDQYTVVAESAAQTVTAGSLQTFSTNVPVHAGDIVGLETTASGCAFTTTSSEIVDDVVTDPPPGTTSTYQENAGYRVNVSATLTSPPESSLSVPGCSQSGALTGSVTPDTGATAKALHYKIDGGPEQSVATTGSAGTVVVNVPQGRHSVEYWGEDSLGQLGPHHTAAVVVDRTPPSVRVTSDQHRTSYSANQRASITTVASDSIDSLTANPSRAHERLSTKHAGSFSVSKTATDQCGNSSTGMFRYKVAPTVTKPHLSPAAFRAAAHGGSTAGNSTTGTRISYRSSDKGKTRFVVSRPVSGVKRGKSCVAPPKNGTARHARRCTRYVKLGSFSHSNKAGRNSFHFTGRVNGGELKPGSYRLSATPVARGRTGRTVSTGFRIKP